MEAWGGAYIYVQEEHSIHATGNPTEEAAVTET